MKSKSKIFATASALALVAGCGSQTPSMPSTALPQPTESYCSIFSTNCGPQGTNQPDPSQSTYHSIFDSDTPAPPPADHDQTATWGDMKFGDCSLSLWPARQGLGAIRRYYPSSEPQEENGTQAAIVGEASSVCVGFQPKEFNLTITLEQWSSTKKGSPATWHEAPGFNSTVSSVDLPPIGIINPRTGMPPFSMQHVYHVFTPCIAGATVTYRLQITIVGVSYGGSPIVGGGTGATWTSLPDAC